MRRVSYLGRIHVSGLQFDGQLSIAPRYVSAKEALTKPVCVSRLDSSFCPWNSTEEQRKLLLHYHKDGSLTLIRLVEQGNPSHTKAAWILHHAGCSNARNQRAFRALIAQIQRYERGATPVALNSEAMKQFLAQGKECAVSL